MSDMYSSRRGVVEGLTGLRYEDVRVSPEEPPVFYHSGLKVYAPHSYLIENYIHGKYEDVSQASALCDEIRSMRLGLERPEVVFGEGFTRIGGSKAA